MFHWNNSLVLWFTSKLLKSDKIEEIIPDKHSAIERPGNDKKLDWSSKNELFQSISYFMGRAIFSRQRTCPIKSMKNMKVTIKKMEDLMQIPLCGLDQLLSEYETKSHIPA